MNVLISIKPEFVEKIITQEKKYEFRKRIFTKNVENVIIYSTVPDKKIIGYFESNEVFKDHPKRLWESFSNKSGISKNDFFKYFKDKDEGYALKIDNLNLFNNPINTDELNNFLAPQSFKYIDDEELENIIKLSQ